jgi:superfamily II RNA helicase
VAAGVDFPARTVSFLNSDRFNGREFVPLTTTELMQMTGRAGRRGKDRIGFAMVIPGKYMDVRRVGKLLGAPAVPVHSQIRINFSMVLNLLLSHRPEEVEDLLGRSLAAFQRHGEHIGGPGAAHDHLWGEFLRHLEFLRAAGFVDERNRLTDDGLWAAQLRIDQPLLVAESLRRELLPSDSPGLLAALMAGFVNDKETDEHLETKSLPHVLIQAVGRVMRELRGFAKFMQSRGFEVRPIYFKPTAAVWAWAEGHSWEKAVINGQMAEGDLAMLVLRTADNLRHVAALKAVFPAMADAARQAIQRILRDPVVPEYELMTTSPMPASAEDRGTSEEVESR